MFRAPGGFALPARKSELLEDWEIQSDKAPLKSILSGILLPRIIQDTRYNMDPEVFDEGVVVFQVARMAAEVCSFKKSELMIRRIFF